MSNFESDVEIEDATGSDEPLEPTMEVLSPRPVLLGPRQEVRRVLPNKDRRMIGAWCFVDHYGPEDITGRAGMRVPPHPHSGLQTVSWLFDGEVEHRDSLGSHAIIEPGQLNLMTSGPGIAHSEESASGHSAIMHGVQLWVALPENARHDAPRDFTQYRDLPVIERDGLRATIVTGEFEGAVSPAATFTPLVGVDLLVSGDVTIELAPGNDYGVLAIDAGLVVEGQSLDVSEIAYVGGGRTALQMSSPGGSRRAFVLGGEPFEEPLVMWWNFIGRTHEEIVDFRLAWNEGPASAASPDDGRPGSADGGQFGVVQGFDGDRLIAPPMPTIRLKSRGRRR
jgi:redox-sensitive bicupin YhaK (pirin superfamily)